MIIVEGPDGGGKTTLVNTICQEFDLKQGERSEKDRDKIYLTTRRDTWYAMSYELHCSSGLLVWDRLGPFSDPVYSALDIPVVRRCSFTDAEIRMFNRFCQELCLVIVCMPRLEVLIENAEKGHQLPGVVEKTKKIWGGYMKTMPNYFHFDYNRNSHQHHVMHLVQMHLDRRTKREALSA